MTVPDDPDDPIGAAAILEGAAAICPAGHRHDGNPAAPPCANCQAAAESVLRAALPKLVDRLLGDAADN